MTSETQRVLTQDDMPEEEMIGHVPDEHGESCVPGGVWVLRKAWPARTFWVLSAHDGGVAAVDLDRDGWERLADLCQTVVERIDSEVGPDDGA